MITIKGIYENGEVKLLESAPPVSKTKVIVTFLEEDDQEEDEIRRMSLTYSGKFFEDYLSDEREDLYQDYAKKETK